MDSHVNITRTHLRIARPTDDLDAMVSFYRDGLDFEVLSQFTDHVGYRVVLQNAGWPAPV